MASPLAKTAELGFLIRSRGNIRRWSDGYSRLCVCTVKPCVSVCRYNASYRTDDGIVAVDHKKCVGCELCVFACPYGVRVMRREKNVADSCDLCLERVIAGEEPYCVQACPTGAMVFGDLDDPESRISRLIRCENAAPLKEKYRTKPRVLYANMGKRDLVEKAIGGHPR